MVGEQGTSRPSDFLLGPSLGSCPSSRPLEETRQALFHIVYRKFTHRQLTNQTGQGRLARRKVHPILLVTTDHESRVWVLYCGLESETQWSRKLFCVYKALVPLSVRWDRLGPSRPRCCSEVARLALDRTPSKPSTRPRSQATCQRRRQTLVRSP